MPITLTGLRCFVTLAQELHFRRASELLRMKPPSLTYQIERLESEVGQTLFTRTSRGVALTACGAELLPLARAAVADVEAIETFITRQHTANPGHLGIGSLLGGLGRHTTPILTDLMQRAPGLQVEVIRCEPTNFVRLLREGKIDLGISPMFPGRSFPDDIRSIRVAAAPRAVILPSTHEFADRDSVTLAQIEAETYLQLGDASFDVWARIGALDPRPNGHQLNWGARAADIEGLLEMCAAGLGIHLGLEQFGDRYARAGLSFVPVSDAPPADLVIAHLKTNTSPLIALFTVIAGEHLQ